MLMKIIQVLFRGCPSFKELLFSIFSSMRISGDLNSHIWFRYAEIGVGLLAGSILASRSIFTLYFQYKTNLETLSKDGYSEKIVKLHFINRFSVYLH